MVRDSRRVDVLHVAALCGGSERYCDPVASPPAVRPWCPAPPSAARGRLSPSVRLSDAGRGGPSRSRTPSQSFIAAVATPSPAHSRLHGPHAGEALRRESRARPAAMRRAFARLRETTVAAVQLAGAPLSTSPGLDYAHGGPGSPLHDGREPPDGASSLPASARSSFSGVSSMTEAGEDYAWTRLRCLARPTSSDGPAGGGFLFTAVPEGDESPYAPYPHPRESSQKRRTPTHVPQRPAVDIPRLPSDRRRQSAVLSTSPPPHHHHHHAGGGRVGSELGEGGGAPSSAPQPSRPAGLTQRLEAVHAALGDVFALLRRVAAAQPTLPHGRDGSHQLRERAGPRPTSPATLAGLLAELDTAEATAAARAGEYLRAASVRALRLLNAGSFTGALVTLARAEAVAAAQAGLIVRYLPTAEELAGYREAQRGAAESAVAPTRSTPDPATAVWEMVVPYFAPAHEEDRRRAAAALDNNYALYHFSLGEFAAAKERLTQAADAESALGPASVPTMGVTYMNLAQTLWELHQRPEALAALERCEEVVERQVLEAKGRVTALKEAQAAAAAARAARASAERYGWGRPASPASSSGTSSRHGRPPTGPDSRLGRHSRSSSSLCISSSSSVINDASNSNGNKRNNTKRNPQHSGQGHNGRWRRTGSASISSDPEESFFRLVEQYGHRRGRVSADSVYPGARGGGRVGDDDAPDAPDGAREPAATSALREEERGFVAAWLAWREFVCLLSRAHEQHGRWLDAMGDPHHAAAQYDLSLRWQTAVPRLGGAEQRRVAALQAALAACRRHVRRRAVEEALYHRPQPEPRSSAAARGSPAPARSTVVTTLLPRHVEVIDESRPRFQRRGLCAPSPPAGLAAALSRSPTPSTPSGAAPHRRPGAGARGHSATGARAPSSLSRPPSTLTRTSSRSTLGRGPPCAGPRSGPTTRSPYLSTPTAARPRPPQAPHGSRAGGGGEGRGSGAHRPRSESRPGPSSPAGSREPRGEGSRRRAAPPPAHRPVSGPNGTAAYHSPSLSVTSFDVSPSLEHSLAVGSRESPPTPTQVMEPVGVGEGRPVSVSHLSSRSSMRGSSRISSTSSSTSSTSSTSSGGGSAGGGADEGPGVHPTNATAAPAPETEAPLRPPPLPRPVDVVAAREYRLTDDPDPRRHPLAEVVMREFPGPTHGPDAVCAVSALPDGGARAGAGGEETGGRVLAGLEATAGAAQTLEVGVGVSGDGGATDGSAKAVSPWERSQPPIVEGSVENGGRALGRQEVMNGVEGCMVRGQDTKDSHGQHATTGSSSEQTHIWEREPNDGARGVLMADSGASTPTSATGPSMGSGPATPPRTEVGGLESDALLNLIGERFARDALNPPCSSQAPLHVGEGRGEGDGRHDVSDERRTLEEQHEGRVGAALPSMPSPTRGAASPLPVAPASPAPALSSTGSPSSSVRSTADPAAAVRPQANLVKGEGEAGVGPALRHPPHMNVTHLLHPSPDAIASLLPAATPPPLQGTNRYHQDAAAGPSSLPARPRPQSTDEDNDAAIPSSAETPSRRRRRGRVFIYLLESRGGGVGGRGHPAQATAPHPSPSGSPQREGGGPPGGWTAAGPPRPSPSDFTVGAGRVTRPVVVGEEWAGGPPPAAPPVPALTRRTAAGDGGGSMARPSFPMLGQARPGGGGGLAEVDPAASRWTTAPAPPALPSEVAIGGALSHGPPSTHSTVAPARAGVMTSASLISAWAALRGSTDRSRSPSEDTFIRRGSIHDTVATEEEEEDDTRGPTRFPPSAPGDGFRGFGSSRMALPTSFRPLRQANSGSFDNGAVDATTTSTASFPKSVLTAYASQRTLDGGTAPYVPTPTFATIGGPSVGEDVGTGRGVGGGRRRSSERDTSGSGDAADSSRVAGGPAHASTTRVAALSRQDSQTQTTDSVNETVLEQVVADEADPFTNSDGAIDADIEELMVKSMQRDMLLLEAAQLIQTQWRSWKGRS